MKQIIESGQAVLGIELGSTRIKAVLIGPGHAPIASGDHNWENRLENGMWTYSLNEVWAGLQSAYARLGEDVFAQYGAKIENLAGVGISAMMHGYLPFDAAGAQLAPFRTWRNTTTEQAAALLTEAFGFNVPQRWSIAHLYQALLNGEAHVKDVGFLTTLAGYVHWQLTGEKVLGVGDASGMFPIDSATGQYSQDMLARFKELATPKGFGQDLVSILPKVLNAGEEAGRLTEKGARMLDPGGTLRPGAPLCPPEGDAGTGMAATNSVAPRTGNISAGTSIFAMIVLEKELARVHTEIDMVTTPTGKPVAMVHCNNCTTDLDAWLGLFRQVIQQLGGAAVEKPALYDVFYAQALQGDADCGGLLNYNYYSGEPITALDEGRPLFARLPNANFNLANFARCQLFSAMATLKIGMDILAEEQVEVDQLLGHGGLFKTKEVGQKLMAAALGAPVSVMDSAGEGGAWGIALLAAYRANKAAGESLEAYLNDRVFGQNAGSRVAPNARDAEGFAAFMGRYLAGLDIERSAVKNMKSKEDAQ